MYGVCGEGMGHAIRSKILINYLKKKNHEVKIIAGGKAYAFLSKEFKDVIKCEWPGSVYKNNKLKLFHTILRFSYRSIIGSLPNYFKIRKLIKGFKPDILITDAEVISYNAAFISKIKRVSIDNPQSMLFRNYNVKLNEIPSRLFLVFMMKLTVFNPDKYIIYDFFDEQITDDKVLFLKPLIQEGLLRKKSGYQNHVFVYQTSISNQYLFEVLKKIDEKFIVYGMNKDQKDENLIYKKFNENDFYDDLSSSKAVITNGGFTVISEALYLKKPILSLPIQNQFEQILNGRFIEKLGAGVSYKKFNEEKIKEFFKNIDIYQKNLVKYIPGKQEETLKIIEKTLKNLISS